MKNYLLTISLFLVSMLAQSVEPDINKTLRFEPIPFKKQPLYCDNNERIEPEESDFSLIDYSIMSSDEGERFALITLENTSSGHRILKNKHLVVVFGDCSRSHPVSVNKRINGGETVTVRAYLGVNRFPVLKLLASERT